MGFFANRKKNKLKKFLKNKNCSDSLNEKILKQIEDESITAEYQISRLVDAENKNKTKVVKKTNNSEKQKTEKQKTEKKEDKYKNMSDIQIELYFKDNIIEDEKEARAILENVKDQKLLTDIVMSWSGFRKNNLIIMDYITDEECLSRIYVNCADPECCKKANEIRNRM